MTRESGRTTVLKFAGGESGYGPKVFIDIVKTVDDRVEVIPRAVILILSSAASFSVVTLVHDLSETAVGKFDGQVHCTDLRAALPASVPGASKNPALSASAKRRKWQQCRRRS